MNASIRVLLVYPNIWSDVFPLSILTLSAVLKQQGAQVEVFTAVHHRRVNSPPQTVQQEGPDASVFEEFRQRIKCFQPDLIGFSVVEDAFPLASLLMQCMASSEAFVIVGGVFATFAPDKVMAHPRVDALCRGEGEQPLSKLCQQLSAGKPVQGIAGLWIRRQDGSIEKNPPNSPLDLDLLPAPDYGILDRTRFNGPVPLIAHRGCPYDCSFCNSPAQNRLMKEQSRQPYFRKQGMVSIRRDLQNLHRHHADKINKQGLYFCSDTLLAWSQSEFDAFIETYSDYRYPFICHTTPETITARKMEKLVEVGLKLINIGVQHGNERFRRELLNRRLPNRELVKRFDMVADSGARSSADFIIGFPLETPALAQDSIDFSHQLRTTARMGSLFAPYHGTALRALAIERGLLTPDVLAVWAPPQSQLEMVDFPRHQINLKMAQFRSRSKLSGNRLQESEPVGK